MKSKYTDLSAVIQVIGHVYKHPEDLDLEEKYQFFEDDFTEEFHKVIFASIYNLHQLGATEINTSLIEDYLAQRPDKMAVYTLNKGASWLEQVAANTTDAAFDFYYNRMRKMTLLRQYEQLGFDVSWLYNPNSLDVKKKNAQEEKLNNSSLSDLADEINEKIDSVRAKFVDDSNEDFTGAGEGIHDLINKLKVSPNFGYPLFGPLVNTVHRGAIPKKFYLRSAATGIGKTRSMIADACSIGCSEIYDLTTNTWISTGAPQPTLFISTEQEMDEIQTMMLAFLSGVDEEKIIQSTYTMEDEVRILHAAELLKNGKLIIKKLPDFSMQDIENTIKFGIRQYGIKFIFHDYIHSSVKILSEIGSKSGIKGLREDNILFLISVKLKDLCNKYNVFIMSATQLNAGYTDADIYDQNLLRGAKAIADKIDVGMIMLEVTNDDMEALRPVLDKEGLEAPTVKISIYKNRRGRWKNVLLWCKADRGICRIEPMFVTDYSYKLIDMPETKINVI